MRGRKPDAAALATSGRQFVAPGVEDAFEVQPPEELTPLGARIWSIMVPDLIRTRVFAPSDIFLVTEMVESLSMSARYRRQEISLLDRLEAAEDAGDDELADKLSARLKRAKVSHDQKLKRAQSLASDFGMNPVARMRIGLSLMQADTLLGAFGMDDDGE